MFGGLGEAGVRCFARGTAQTGPETLGVLLVGSVGCGPGSDDGASPSPSEAARAQPETLPGSVGRWVPLTVADLPPLMSVPPSVDTSPYRFPLLQFIWDWNVADDRPALVAAAPIYHGDDPLLLPAVAVVVHALADRAGVALPG